LYPNYHETRNAEYSISTVAWEKKKQAIEVVSKPSIGSKVKAGQGVQPTA
jgi:hypothetical protein